MATCTERKTDNGTGNADFTGRKEGGFSSAFQDQHLLSDFLITQSGFTRYFGGLSMILDNFFRQLAFTHPLDTNTSGPFVLNINYPTDIVQSSRCKLLQQYVRHCCYERLNDKIFCRRCHSETFHHRKHTLLNFLLKFFSIVPVMGHNRSPYL